jgi:N-acetylmuramic acid 6-phosphate etherase
VRACDVSIAVEVGPEVIAGSTRMKGGLAQKMVLHTLSTAVMVRLGRVRGNLMTGVRAANRKLRERAIWIATELAGCSRQEAQRALDAAGGDVERALALLGVGPADD